MKKLILASLCAFIVVAVAIAPSATAQKGTVMAFSQFAVTNNHTVDTNWVSGTNILAMKVTISGMKAGGVSNAANVFIGPITGATAYVVAPGTVHTLETQPGTCLKLQDWWLRVGTTGDGITIIYQ